MTRSVLLPDQKRAMVLLVNANEQMYHYALWSVAEKAALSLAGITPQPNVWGSVPWVARGLLLLPAIQVAIIIATLRRIKRWQIDPASRPGPERKWLLPTLLNLALVAVPVGLLASGMFQFITLFMGDFVAVFLLSGAIALAWICARTWLILRAPRAN